MSDTSPIRALNHLGLLALCQKLYGDVIVPAFVGKELLRATKNCPAIDISAVAGFKIQAAKSSPASRGVPADLDPGEAEAISLAIEVGAHLLLMDERKGTQAAQQLGLTTIGVFGILLEAKRAGFIPAVLPCVDRLVRELRFFASPSLRARLAVLAGE